ncbi:MAG: MazG nucleotide pyrophosphohydrolase domain-containing protein [Elusimicrobiota bacterium]
MNKRTKKHKHTWNGLLKTMSRLRSPGGCPWDAKQTHRTLLPYLKEETGELRKAILSGIDEDIKDELGDVLLQVIFHAQIASDNGKYDITDVIDNLTRKLHRRHPHVYGKTKINSIKELITNWDRIKRKERIQNIK